MRRWRTVDDRPTGGGDCPPCRWRRPVRTAFGVMPDRPAIFLSVEDKDGARGWGEIWCNFPSLRRQP